MRALNRVQITATDTTHSSSPSSPLPASSQASLPPRRRRMTPPGSRSPSTRPRAAGWASYRSRRLPHSSNTSSVRWRRTRTSSKSSTAESGQPGAVGTTPARRLRPSIVATRGGTREGASFGLTECSRFSMFSETVSEHRSAGGLRILRSTNRATKSGQFYPCTAKRTFEQHICEPPWGVEPQTYALRVRRSNRLS